MNLLFCYYRPSCKAICLFIQAQKIAGGPRLSVFDRVRKSK